MKIKWKLALLLLDDQPEANREQFERLLKELGATVLSEDETSRAGRTYLLKGWEFGEDIEISVKTLGGSKELMLASIADEHFMRSFDAAFVDMRWDRLSPTFSARDFGSFALDFRGVDKAGLLLARLIKDHAPDLITVIVTQNDIEPPDVKWAIQRSGAFQFIRKQQIIELFNVIVYCMERVRQRESAEQARQAATGVRMSRLRNASATSDFDAFSHEARLLNSLPEPNETPKSVEEISRQSGLSVEVVRKKLPMLKTYLLRHGLTVDVSGANCITKEVD